MRCARLACALLLLPAGPASALTAAELFEQRSPSIFVVHTYDKQGKQLGTGSGVVIGPEQMITNCHVLAKAASITISRGNARFGATLEFPDPERDLCQLKVRELAAPPVPLGAAASVKVGHRVFAIGAPLGLELTLSDGLVSSLRELDEGRAPLIQTSTPISPGSSGGALFDEEGRLVGITTFGFRGQQLNFAVPVDWVREVPERGRELLAKRKAAAEAQAASRPDPGLPKEMPQQGDTWTYALVDLIYNPGDRSRRFVHTVRSVSPQAIVEEIAQGGQVLESRFTADTSAVYRVQADLLEVAPYITAFRKLSAGEQWQAVYIRPLQVVKGGDVPYRFEQARVVGAERIRVPAGSFEAVRVELQGRVSTFHLYPGSPSMIHRGGAREAPFQQTVWYAPEVKRIVRLLMQADGVKTAYELESYSLH